MRAFVVAMECEAEQVRPFLGEGDVLVVSGIGKVNAAAAAQKAIDGGADEILNCGLVGGLDTAMAVGDVFEVSQAVEYDFDLAVLNGTGLGVHDERDTPYFDCAAKGVYPVRILASGDRFTNDLKDVEDSLSLGAALRDMEGAAIAHVCERNGMKCRMLKVVSDVHGKGAMTGQYLQNRESTLARLRASIPAWL